ncbi:MAG: MarR family winged helix-turn-helix transcriptional regulator [Terriglobales bacterium]
MRISRAQIEHLAEFRYALRQFLRFSEREARRAGLSPQQHQLLLAIKGMPGRDWAHVIEIAERLQVSHHAAVALVTRAQRQGLVRRQRGAVDRRTVEVRLTPRGEETIARLATLHAAELGRLAELLRQRLAALADRHPGPRGRAAAPPIA